MNFKRILRIEKIMALAVLTVICLVWMVNNSWQWQLEKMHRGFFMKGELRGTFALRSEAKVCEGSEIKDTKSYTVVFLDGSPLFEDNELMVEPIRAMHVMLASLTARGSIWPLVFLFFTPRQIQLIEKQQGVAVRALRDIFNKSDVQIVEKRQEHLWTHDAARVLNNDTYANINLPPWGTYLLLSTPYVVTQQSLDNWGKSFSPSVNGGGYPKNGGYVLVMSISPIPNSIGGNVAFDSHCVVCNNANHSADREDPLLSTAFDHENKHRNMTTSDLLSQPTFSGDVVVATSLAAARDFLGRVSEHEYLLPMCPEQYIINGFMVTCYASTTQAQEAQGPTLITQDIQSIDSTVLFVRKGEGLVIDDGSVLREGSKIIPWIVAGYNQNEDLQHYFGIMYPMRSMEPYDDTVIGMATGEYPVAKDGRTPSGDRNGGCKKEQECHVRGLVASLSAVKAHKDRVDALENWAAASRAEVKKLTKPQCHESLKFPDFSTMTSVLNPEDISTVHLVGVEDLHRYNAISDYPKYVLPDGDDQQVCALWPDSSFCNNATMSKHTCRWKRFIQATDCAFIDDGSALPEIPGLVYDSKHWYPDHAQKDSVPWSNSSKVIHEYDELGNGLSTYGAAPAHFWIEVLPQILHMNAVLPPHVKLLVDDSNNQVKRIIEYMYKKKILPANRIESWKGRGHVYAAKRVYHSAEMALPPTETMNQGALESLSSEFKYIAVEFCFWKNALPLHLVRWSFQPYFQPAGQRRDIVVLHRRDAESRKVKNHGEVIALLRDAFPLRDVVELVISEHPVERVAQIMFKAGLFIAPHGAGLVNMLFLAPGTPVIEFAYTDPGRMAWPADYFYPSAINLELKYGIVLADGHYDSEMTVPPEKVVSLSKSLLADP